MVVQDKYMLEKESHMLIIYADNKGNADLTRSLVEDEEKAKDINLGSLTGFFGYSDVKNRRRYRRNKDLLRTGVSEDTYEFIVDTFTTIIGLRNGYFHKHNLKDWHKVDEARDNAFLVHIRYLKQNRMS